MTYTLIPNIWYTITPETDCDLATPNGISIHLPAGIQYFHFADCVSIDISGTATITQNPPLFKPASASALGGGYIESNLNVGHGASATVAAQCTLTLGDLATGGTLTDSNGQSVELENPHKYAEGGAAFRDASEACTLTIGEWSKTWEKKKDAKASGVFSIMGDVDTISVTNGEDEYSVQVPANYDTGVDGWNAAFAAAGCGIVCTAVDVHGEVEVSVEAAEIGETGNGIVISVEGYEPVTLGGGSSARTAVDVFNDILEDADCPVDVTLDADEQGLGFTAKEYGVNDAISAEGDMFSNWTGMSGGHGDYSVAELVTAIAGEFEDIMPTAGEAEGTIVLTSTATEHQADANRITYTATGCFGGGTVKQGSTTRGKNAVAQTAFKIYLNGEELDVEPAPLPAALTPTTAMRNGGVYTVAADIDARNVTLPANATARIWVYEDTGPLNVQWPSWKWLTEDGMQPEFDYFKQYRLQVECDNLSTTVKVVDSYEVRPEFVHESLTESNRTDTGLQLYLLAAETTQSAGAYDSNDKGPQEAFNSNGDEYYCCFSPLNEKNLLEDEFTPPEMPDGFPLSYGHHQAVTFCTARALNVHAISAELWSQSEAKALFQARVNDTWVDIGGEITMTTGKRNYILHPEAAVVASKFRLLITGAWVRRYVDKIRIFEK